MEQVHFAAAAADRDGVARAEVGLQLAIRRDDCVHSFAGQFNSDDGFETQDHRADWTGRGRKSV